MAEYRPNVGIMLVNHKGLVFVAERLDRKRIHGDGPGKWWQMPQGGIDRGESVTAAALRELEEETGIAPTKVSVVAESEDWFTYDFPTPKESSADGIIYKGQRQKWVLMMFNGVEADINLAMAHPEFSKHQWVPLSQVKEMVVEFKTPVYAKVEEEFAPLIRHRVNQQKLDRRGSMVIISAPGGCGKSTVRRELLALSKFVRPSISCTTRAPRPGEVEGVDYFFISKEQFEKDIAAGNFIEYTKFVDNYYGTPKGFVEESLRKGIDIIFTIEAEGMQKLKEYSAKDAITIFMLPPSNAELRTRLERRGDPAPAIDRRMQEALKEVLNYKYYDYIVINDDLNDTVQKILKIIKAERLKRSRMLRIEEFIDNL